MNNDVALGKITPDYELSNSLLAASMGKSTWQTPNEVLKNCHLALMGENIRTETTSRQEVGNVLEKPVAELASKSAWVRTESGDRLRGLKIAKKGDTLSVIFTEKYFLKT